MRTTKEYEVIASGEEVVLRGFLYKKGEDQWILADEPNLKTCCVGSTDKALHQVVLEGHLDNSLDHRVATVKGTWRVQPYSFHLINAEEVTQPTTWIPWIGLGIILCVALWSLRGLFLRPKSPPPKP